MFKTRLFAGAALAVMVLATTAIQTATLAGGGNNDHRVRAVLTGDTLASGKARYRERTRGNGDVEQRFDVQVEDATPGNMMQIHVNGLMVGIIVIDDLGRGELQYRTPAFIDDPGDGDPIPDGFPTLIIGDMITVGPLGGVFEDD